MMLSEKEKDRLKNRYGPWVLITGASSGIGKEMAKQLASAGLNLVLIGRGKQKLESSSKALQKVYNVQVWINIKDLGNKAEVEDLKKDLAELDIGLAVLSAGFGTSGLFKSSDLENEMDMLNVNCTSLLSLTHHFSSLFSERKKGGIIMMSSIVAFQGVPFSANYSATKAYVQSLGEGIAHELKSEGVDVLTVAPGPVETNFAQRANLEMGSALGVREVVIPSLKAIGRKTHINPGWLTRVLKGALNTAPRVLRIRIMSAVMRGMTTFNV